MFSSLTWEEELSMFLSLPSRRASLRSSPLLETLILVERTLTTGWWTTLSTNSNASTRRTSRETREQREPCPPQPRLTLKSILYSRELTSTPASPEPGFEELCSDLFKGTLEPVEKA